LLGFDFDDRSAVCLSKWKKSSSFSDPERSALQSLVQRAVSCSFNIESSRQLKKGQPFVTRNHNGFFVFVRIRDLGLATVTVVRVNSYQDHRWIVESVCAFSLRTWKRVVMGKMYVIIHAYIKTDVLEWLISEFLQLEYDHSPVQFHHSCDKSITLWHPSQQEGSNDFFSWQISDFNMNRIPSTFHEGMLTGIRKKVSPVDGEEDLSLLLGKTSFSQKVEFQRIQRAFKGILSGPHSTTTMQTYYNMLQRNYVHDTEMADHLEYFGKLCELYAMQIEKKPSILSEPKISDSFEYLCEDLTDAMDMARENGELESTIESAALALDKLTKALRSTKSEI
jgi:hypothetical protein